MNKSTIVGLLAAIWFGVVCCNDYYPEKQTLLKKIQPVVVSSSNSDYNAPPPPPPPPPQNTPSYPTSEQEYPSSSSSSSTIHFKTLCPKSRSGEQQFYMPHSERREWFLQCDQNGQVFLKFCPPGTIFTDKLVCEETAESISQRVAIGMAETSSSNSYNPIIISVTPMAPAVQLPAQDSYGYPEPYSAPAAVQSSSFQSKSLAREAPEFRALCDSERTLSSASFYLPHPSERSWFIQCDEFGNAFLQSCTPGLFFSKDFVCKREGEDVETTIVERPQPAIVLRGPSLSTYQSGAISDMAILTSTSTESGRRAPEFDEACRARLRSGVIVFYMKHPSDVSKFIQCDEFGAAFLKQCSSGLLFDERLACARQEEIQLAEQLGQLQQTRVSSKDNSYGYQEASSSINSGQSQQANQGLDESLEFKQMCASKPTHDSYGAVVNNAFFLPHPVSDMLYIQCDEFGRAFVRQCQFGTVFVAESKACMKPTELSQTIQFNMPAETFAGGYDPYGTSVAAPLQVILTTNGYSAREEKVVLVTQAPVIVLTTTEQAYPAAAPETIVLTTETYGHQEQIKVAKIVESRPVPKDNGY